MSGVHPIEALEAGLSPLRKLRIVAVVEFCKALAVIAAGAGWLGADAGALEAAARALLHALALDPAQGLATNLLDMARDADANPGWVTSALGAYAAARLAEAGGLWHGRNWARWLGLVSAGLYVPFELAYAVHRPGAAAIGVLALNVAVLWLLWPPRAGADD